MESSSFYGDKVRWFLGTVINISDPMLLRRVQVRIHGIHPNDHTLLQNADLPWATVTSPTSSGGVSGIGAPPALLAGAQVFGFFMDGRMSQLPMVLGSIPHIGVPSEQQEQNFQEAQRANPVSIGYGLNQVDPALARAAGLTSNSTPSAGGTNLKDSAMSTEAIERVVRTEAVARNIDPNVAVRIYRSEGYGAYQSQIPKSGYGSLGGLEASFGPFQLYTGGGMGNDYETRTGRELVNDNTVEGITNQIRFALDQAVVGGWGPWYGRLSAGIATNEGFNYGGAASVVGRNWS
tara:strand:- start:3927 stop:4802 length:876 start_codon:yes stop_codon:yes gene_type:complete